MTEQGKGAKVYDAREVTLLRESAGDALLSYAEALVWWNEPDFEHSLLQLQRLVSEVIEEMRRGH